MEYVVALDVGGTDTKAALVAADGTVAHATRRPTGRDGGVDAVVAGILDFAEELCAECAERLGSAPRAVGLAVPGVVDERAGVAVFSANLGWRNLPLRRLTEERIGRPVALCHDVRAGGVAEARLGAAQGCEHVLFLPIGTGIAGAALLDGRPYPGGHGASGEIGHVVVAPGGDLCGCGGRGCLETVSSAAAVARRYAAASGQDGISAKDVVRRAAEGDPDAAAVWQDAVEGLADALLIYGSLLDPQLVIVGGGLGSAGEALLGPLRTAVAERITFHVPPRLVAARLGDKAGALGAGLLAWDLLTPETAS